MKNVITVCPCTHRYVVKNTRKREKHQIKSTVAKWFPLIQMLAVFRSCLTLYNKFLLIFFSTSIQTIESKSSHIATIVFSPLPLVYVTHFQVNLLKALLWADHLHSLNGLHCSLTLGSWSSSSRGGGYLSYSDWLTSSLSSHYMCFLPKICWIPTVP